MRLLSAVLGCLLAGTVAADVLEMPDPPRHPTEDRPLVTMELPGKGMSMRQVESGFGAPSSKLPAVGDPPISRWVYEDFTVYFEGKYVVHAVLNQ